MDIKPGKVWSSYKVVSKYYLELDGFVYLMCSNQILACSSQLATARLAILILLSHKMFSLQTMSLFFSDIIAVLGLWHYIESVCYIQLPEVGRRNFECSRDIWLLVWICIDSCSTWVLCLDVSGMKIKCDPVINYLIFNS